MFMSLIGDLIDSYPTMYLPVKSRFLINTLPYARP